MVTIGAKAVFEILLVRLSQTNVDKVSILWMANLSVLIIDQGTVLDRIDYNCEMVAVTVEEGRKQLAKAEDYQKESRLILCIYFLAAMVGVMLLVVIFQKMG